MEIKILNAIVIEDIMIYYRILKMNLNMLYIQEFFLARLEAYIP